MKNYNRINALPPEGIKRKKAHIVGGGIAGMAAAAFLVDDAHMPGENITIYESLDVVGGALDAMRDKNGTHKFRGARMFEERYECMYYLMEKIPSLQTPGLTVLDETHQYNIDQAVHSGLRLMERQGKKQSPTGPMVPPADGQKMLELLLTPEDQLQDMKVGEWFSPEFFDSPFWHYWAYIFAFASHHSLMEVRRYLIRFPQYVGKPLTSLSMIRHVQYNEYDSIVVPLREWLKKKGVRVRFGTNVRDIETQDKGNGKGMETLATALVFDDATGRGQRVPLTRDDLVFFTNGSIVQKSRWGETDTVVTYDRDTSDLGVWDIWKKLAARDPKFGRPETFIGDIDKSSFLNFTFTIKGDSTYADHMSKITGVPAPLRKNGAITIVDANWVPSLFLYGKKYFRDQPDDEDVGHGFILFHNREGNFIKKPARDCTGAEIFSEMLYHCGLKDKIGDILKHATCNVVAMPYIASLFMPRKIADRPKVIPDGCVNLAFLGQFVEVPGDVVFTVEYSIRTAMMAVWGLTGLKKPQIPVYEPMFDIRVLAKSLQMSTGTDSLTAEMLDKVKASASPATAKLLGGAIAHLPEPSI